MRITLTNETIESLTAEQVLDRVLAEHLGARACFTCSFQAEDIVVLHLLRRKIPRIPVLFLETGYHFPETYSYRDRIAQEWSLNLVNVIPKKTVSEQESELGLLYRTEPTKCCQLRKVEPLLEALEPYDLWFTGLRREQSSTRANLKKLEEHRLPNGKTLVKVSLLADWRWGQVWEYTSQNGLSCMPQYDRGYLSIGCEPCTAIPEDPNNPRSGRWGGKKLECGIHTFSQGKS
jgi:phosphoadenosine phosphosulfate reductase